MVKISLTANGRKVTADIDPRTLLVDFLRTNLRLTGTHVGCDTSQCGACTVHLNGRSVKACAVLAASCDGADVVTIEGLSKGDQLHPMQEAFREHHALQCGFCTPGMIIAAKALLDRNPDPDRDEVIDAISGNICRCTGYEPIIDAILAAAAEMRGGKRKSA